MGVPELSVLNPIAVLSIGSGPELSALNPIAVEEKDLGKQYGPANSFVNSRVLGTE